MNNPMFIVIVISIFCLQLLLITFAGSAFGVYTYYGLHPIQWLISVFIFLFRLGLGLYLFSLILV